MAERKVSRSPRAPSVSLDEAIDKTSRIYERERRHAAPVDAVAQNLGYSGARNGAALSTLASLRYYGLIERPSDGQVQVSKDFESYSFAPDENLRRDLRIKWLKSPSVFAELLEKFPGELPSDATLKFTLIQRGFSPTAADECVGVFRRSVEFARFYSGDGDEADGSESESNETITLQPSDAIADAGLPSMASIGDGSKQAAAVDRIPIRLPGNRRAWIEIPSPFFEADKDRLKAQIDLLLTDEDDGE